MHLYMHNIETGDAAKVTIQAEGGDHLYVEPGDVPCWANACSANLALVSYYLDGDGEHQYNGVCYVIVDPRPMWAQPTRVAL